MKRTWQMMNPDNPAAGAWYQAAVRTAWVSGIFCLLVLILLLINVFRTRTLLYSFQIKATDPKVTTRLNTLKDSLLTHPKDEQTKTEIRQADLQLRQELFRRKAFTEHGSYLLLGGIAIFLLSLKFAKQLRKALPKPDEEPAEDPWMTAVMGRQSVTIIGICAGAFLVVTGVFSRHDLSRQFAFLPPPIKPVVESTETATSPLTGNPTAAGSAQNVAFGDLSGQVGIASGSAMISSIVPGGTPSPLATVSSEQTWPMFRGIDGSARALGSRYPTQWNGAEGKNILWKTAIPLPGKNSPVVWGNRLFLSGATEKQREVYCFDTDSGKLVWKQPVPSSGETADVMEETGYAASTMVANGKYACAIFPNGDLACFDFTGKLTWVKKLGAPENMYGYASSLAVYQDRLFVQFDEGSDEESRSALLCLEMATGRLLWQTARPMPSSWSSPILITVGKQRQIVTAGRPWVIAYDPANGHEIWKAQCLDGDVAPAPAFAGGLVFVANVNSKVAAIHPDGKGDITATKILWTATDGLPDTVSPVSDGDLLYLFVSEGTITCYDAHKGTRVWDHDMSKNLRASPILVGKLIYLLDEEGVMHLLQTGRSYKEVGTAQLGEAAYATPAFVSGRIYIRGTSNLYCIGTK
ncbi:MAG: PQQ-like beta-propeller repeat protein [Armatimonadota bacterium]